jgi:hypothetical protein
MQAVAVDQDITVKDWEELVLEQVLLLLDWQEVP